MPVFKDYTLKRLEVAIMILEAIILVIMGTVNQIIMG
jgi:hypothetical protein